MPVSILIHSTKRRAPAHLLEQLDLQRIVHHEIEAVARRFEQLLRREHALEQHDRLADARGAQRQPFLEARHGEGVRLRERQRGRHEPVPIGIGLDHRHDPRAARRGADGAQIVAQRVRCR